MQLRAATIVAIVAAAGCSRNQATAQGGMAFPPTAVKLATVQPTEIQDSTEYVATLKSLHSTSIQPQIEGQITKIFVKSGDRVAEGQTLMQIDPRRQQAAVSSQEAELAAKEASVNFARQQAERAKELYAGGAVSKQELEQAQTGLETAQADLQSLRAQVRQQQEQLRYYTVSAPTPGIVGDIPVRVGYQVTTSTMLTTVDRNETLEVYVNVPLERASELRNGLPLQVWSSDGQQKFADTAVSFISPHVDDQTQSVLVKGTVRNPNLTLRSSQFVRARIVWKTTSGIVVPVTAVLRLNGQFFAFVAEQTEGKLVAKQRPVTLGPIIGNDYPVLAGIKAGEQVVVSGVQKLADNAPIQPT